jgi:hypothetical protein|tara:strand:+ start:188 stop:313 length:126 start_codon:yes stop_codon:yes gene_type:complete
VRNSNGEYADYDIVDSLEHAKGAGVRGVKGEAVISFVASNS